MVGAGEKREKVVGEWWSERRTEDALWVEINGGGLLT
jgi:hypothetical protein